MQHKNGAQRERPRRESFRETERSRSLTSWTSPRHQSRQAGRLHQGHLGWRTEEGLPSEEHFFPLSLDDALCSHPRLHPMCFPDCLWNNPQPFGSADIYFFSHGLSITSALSFAQLGYFVSPSLRVSLLPSATELALTSHTAPRCLLPDAQQP